MPLPLVVDLIETVAEPFRTEYTEKDGKFHLNVDGIDNVYVSRADFKKSNEESAARRRQLDAWKGLGKTPEEIAEMLQKQADAEAEAAKKAGNFDVILKQHQEKSAKELAEKDAELNAARASERDAVVSERVLGALAKAGATEEGLELLPERLANRITFETVDGKRKLTIMQADGKTPMAGGGEGGAATIDDLVKEASTKYLSLFKGSGAGGGGKESDAKPHGGSGVAKKSDFKTEKERAAYVNQHGFKAYEALPA